MREGSWFGGCWTRERRRGRGSGGEEVEGCFELAVRFSEGETRDDVLIMKGIWISFWSNNIDEGSELTTVMKSISRPASKQAPGVSCEVRDPRCFDLSSHRLMSWETISVIEGVTRRRFCVWNPNRRKERERGSVEERETR